jgi:hypothetical protein
VEFKRAPADVDFPDFVHPPWTVAAAQQVPQHGLGLVVRVVGQEHAPAAMEGGAAGEEIMAGPAGGEFERFATVGGGLADVDPPDFAGEPEAAGRGGDEAGVTAGSPAAQTVIEVTDDQFLEAVFDKQVEQGGRVRAAGNADEISTTLRLAVKPALAVAAHGLLMASRRGGENCDFSCANPAIALSL